MGGTPVMKLIEPPNAQWSLRYFRARIPPGPTLTVDEPGLHGDRHRKARHRCEHPEGGCRCGGDLGFEGDEHIPKGGMFIPGAKSMIVPIGMFDARTVGAEDATKDEGAAPNEQDIAHPVLTA